MTHMRTLVLSVLLVATTANAVTLNVSTIGGNTSSPLLYGIMFEDINQSGDGGIHGQLLRNNGLQGSKPDLTAWSPIGGTILAVDTDNPTSAALPRSLKVSVPSNATGQVGISNAGYLGVPVNEDTYTSAFWIKGNYTGDVILSLSGPSGTVYTKKTLPVKSNSTAFTYCMTKFQSIQSNETNNKWSLTFDAAKVNGSSLNFGLLELFGVTFHLRPNGLRKDVATFMAQLKPSFLRFPGGNNLEGLTPDTRWKWNETIGPQHLRPGRQGTWGYPNSDALGLMEYLHWCEDMYMEPVLAVWAGLSLGGVVTGDALKPYIADVLDELDFLLGPTTSKFGALRAQLGQQEPFALKYIEVGNEDMLNGGCESYPGRFTAIYNAIHAVHPELIVIASTSESKCLPKPLPSGAYVDVHHYLSPDAFVASFNEFDNLPRAGGILVGEYGSTVGNDNTPTFWTNMRGSCAEAVYMIGMERNSDLVKMASFAPLLEHFDMAQWSPDLFGLNSTAGSMTPSTSFWVQNMFSANRGQTILPVTSDTGFGPLYWVASSTSDLRYFVKLANYGPAETSVNLHFPDAAFASDATLTMLSGPNDTSNFPGNVAIKPNITTVHGSSSGGYAFVMPPWSVAVLVVPCKEALTAPAGSDVGATPSQSLGTSLFLSRRTAGVLGKFEARHLVVCLTVMFLVLRA